MMCSNWQSKPCQNGSLNAKSSIDKGLQTAKMAVVRYYLAVDYNFRIFSPVARELPVETISTKMVRYAGRPSAYIALSIGPPNGRPNRPAY